MKVLHPIAVTDSVLSACTIAETDHAEWDVATAYTPDQSVIRASLHKVFRAVRNNTGKTPETSPEDWQDMGATNRWRMFDKKVGTVSSATDGFSVTLTPGLINAIGLVGCNAASVTVTMTDPLYGEIFSRTYSMARAVSQSSYWTYFFEPRGRKTTLVIEGLPTSRNPTVVITLNAAAGQTASLGSLLVGRMYEYERAALLGASVGIKDFGRKERDTFGNWQIVERTWSRRANWNFILQNRDMDEYLRRMSTLRSTPALFIGGSYDSTAIYGFYLDTEVVIKYPHHSECSIEIEGLEET
jgi:hypothetical protein